MFRKGGKTYFKGLKKGKGKSRSKTVPKALKAYVNSQIVKNEEPKVQSFTAQTTLLTYDAATTTLRTLDFNNVISLVNQGTGEGQRVGNKIKIISANIKGWVSILPTSVGFTPVIVKMFVGRLKQALTNPNVSTLYSRFFQNGNSSLPPQNNYFDMLRVPNKDLFMIYNTKTFKIAQASQTAGSSNNDFSMLGAFNISLAKHYHNLTFDDTTPTPSNQAVYIWFMVANADGTATNIIVPPTINLCYDMEVKYTDA